MEDFREGRLSVVNFLIKVVQNLKLCEASVNSTFNFIISLQFFMAEAYLILVSVSF